MPIDQEKFNVLPTDVKEMYELLKDDYASKGKDINSAILVRMNARGRSMEQTIKELFELI